MEIFGILTNRYMDWQRNHADSMADIYPLMQNPMGMILILFVYFLIVFYGPRVMVNREAFELRCYNMLYNTAQVFFCGIYVVRVYQLTEMEPEGLYLMCKKWNRDRNALTEEIAFYQYINFVSRVCELSETVVHVLRKKTRQLSYLHIVHHGMNLILSWLSARFQPGGTSSTICLVNFAVHFVMYGYYLLAAQHNPLFRKIASGFKKYMTCIQLLQFSYMLLIIFMEILEYPPCKIETFISYAGLVVFLTNSVLFLNFYNVNYLTNKKVE